jgi:signal peptidase I
VTPIELFGLICVFAVVRVAISLKREPVAAGAGSAVPSARTVIREYLDAFIVAGLVALFLITFVVRTFFIPSGSMEPTLQIHDVLLVNEFEYRLRKPAHGDIVVFVPGMPSPNDFIKRLIGAPGDTLSIDDGVVTRNGQKLDEPYIKDKPNYRLVIKDYSIWTDTDGSMKPLDPTQANIPPKSAWQAPDRIPNGCYFMMGDNRNNSDDSHIWGFAQTGGTFASGPVKGNAASFTGHAFLVFWPLDRIRILH